MAFAATESELFAIVTTECDAFAGVGRPRAEVTGFDPACSQYMKVIGVWSWLTSWLLVAGVEMLLFFDMMKQKSGKFQSEFARCRLR